MRRLIIPLLLIGCFIGESLFVEYFSLDAFSGHRIIVPHFLLVVLLLMTVYYFRNRTIAAAFLFGLFYDVYYTGILGVYLCLFPLSVYLTSKLMKMLQSNLLIVSIVTVINIAFIEVMVYQLNQLIFNVPMQWTEFGDLRLWPTLILNLVFFIIVAYPIKKQLLLLKKKEETS